jgi:hypothetical protein
LAAASQGAAAFHFLAGRVSRPTTLASSTAPCNRPPPPPYSSLAACHRPAKLASMNTPTPVNHVFVDFENVYEIDPALIGAKSTEFTLLIGPENKKLDLDVVEKLLTHAGAVQFIRLADPAGYFHLISKDKGYDPLLDHLKGKHVHVRRHEDFASLSATLLPIPAQQPPAAIAQARQPAKPALSGDAAHLLEILRSFASRPRTRKTLTRHVITVLGNKINEEQAGHLIRELCSAGKIAINAQDKVEYRFPSPPAT